MTRIASATIIAVTAALAAGGCGDDDEPASPPAAVKPAVLSITTSDAGKDRFTMRAPASIRGGLVQIRFTNATRTGHEAQLVRVDRDRTRQDVLRFMAGGSATLPDWAYAEGGVGAVPPGQTATATQNLPAGSYYIVDSGEGDPPVPSQRGAIAALTVTAGADGELPATTATITTSDAGETGYSFEARGLKAGTNTVLFDNDSEDAPHHVVAFPMKPGATIAGVERVFAQRGEPTGPPPLDFAAATSTAALDGSRSLVTTLTLRKGRYALVCFLTDRDDDKPHLHDGMIEAVEVGEQ